MTKTTPAGYNFFHDQIGILGIHMQFDKSKSAGTIFSKKTVIFSHYLTTGATEELRDWLIVNKAKEVVYIAFPFLYVSEKSVCVSIYKHGELIKEKRSLLRFSRPEPLSFIKDFFYCLFYGIRFCRETDFLIGGDNLLSIAGIWLKNLGFVRKVIYYMIDYTPVRYQNRYLNSLYYAFDRAAAYGADAVWPLIENTIEGRFRDGKLKRERVNWYAVPYGNHSKGIRIPIDYEKNTLVYMGGLIKNKGAELFIPIAEFLLKKGISFHFRIIGGGNYLEPLRREVSEKGLSRYFTIYGFMENFDDVLQILFRSGIAIAPYYPEDSNSFTYYADAGKLKVYLGCGLPVVLTPVPPLAPVLVKEGAGVISNYDAEDFAEKIGFIIQNIEIYKEKALLLGKQFDWDSVFSNAFQKMEA